MVQPDPQTFQSPTAEVALVPSSGIVIEQPVERPDARAATTSISDMVVSAFPDAPVMIRIAQAESQMRPEARNPRSTASGLFQILNSTWRAYKCQGSPYNAEDNIACARKIYDDVGTTPWISSSAEWKQ